MNTKIKNFFLNNFLTFFSIYYLTLFLDTTTLEIDYPVIEDISQIIRYIMYIMFFIRIILLLPQYKKDILENKWKENNIIIKILYCMMFVIGISALINSITTIDRSMLFLILILISSYKTNYNKIIKRTMLLQIILTSIVVILCLTGITQDYLVGRTGSDIIRHSLGFCYTTNLAQMIYIYLVGSKTKYTSLAIIQILNIIMYKVTDSRTEFLMLEFVIVITLVLKILKRINKTEIVMKTKKIYSNLFTRTFFIYPIISFIMVICYSFGGVWNQVDTMLSGRLKQTYNNIETYGIKPFGNDVELIGNGIREKLEYKNYKSNFIDNEYLNILFTKGWIFAIAFIFVLNLLLLILYNDKKYNELLLCSIYLFFGLLNPRIINLLYCPILFMVIPIMFEYQEKKKENKLKEA